MRPLKLKRSLWNFGRQNMTEMEVIRLFKCLSDKSRLNILKTLVVEDMYVELLAERLSLSPPTISFHLKKLAEAGAVRSYKNQYYTMYSICKEVFSVRMIDLICEESDEIILQDQREAEYRKRIIDSFFEYGKLKSIPTQQKKRRIILEYIASSFSTDHIYSEREVNLIIADYYDDFCTIRRDMIAEKIMARNKDGYWLLIDNKEGKA